MTPEQLAVIDAAKAWCYTQSTDLHEKLEEAVDDLLDAENLPPPPTPVWPDPPTDRVAWQRTDGVLVEGPFTNAAESPDWRKLRVAYTPADSLETVGAEIVDKGWTGRPITDDEGPLNEPSCTCGEPQSVSPRGFTDRHRLSGPCYVQEHNARFNAVWEAIKGWDLQRFPNTGYAGATGDDVCTILEALDRKLVRIVATEVSE